MTARFFLLLPLLLTAWSIGGTAANAQDVALEQENKKSYFSGVPPITKPAAATAPGALSTFPIPMPPEDKNIKPNTFSPAISAEAKMKAAQTMMSINPLSMRQMINFMAAKKKAAPGLSFDDVIQSMLTRANSLNFKLVGHNFPWKVLEGITGKKQPKLEILTFCDLLVMRKIVDYVPEFVVFLPCRIAVMEDAKGAIWLVTLDWDVRWLDASRNPNRFDAKLRADAIRVRQMIEEVMVAGANGDL